MLLFLYHFYVIVEIMLVILLLFIHLYHFIYVLHTFYIWYITYEVSPEVEEGRVAGHNCLQPGWDTDM
jgi:hypothetical protein